MSTASKIREIRKSMNLSQEKFGALFHMSQRSVAFWESGDRSPSIDVLTAMADISGKTVDWIIDAQTQKKEPAVNDSELRDNLITQIQDLPDSYLVRVSDFLSGLLAGQESAAAAAADRDPIA